MPTTARTRHKIAKMMQITRTTEDECKFADGDTGKDNAARFFGAHLLTLFEAAAFHAIGVNPSSVFGAAVKESVSKDIAEFLKSNPNQNQDIQKAEKLLKLINGFMQNSLAVRFSEHFDYLYSENYSDKNKKNE